MDAGFVTAKKQTTTTTSTSLTLAVIAVFRFNSSAEIVCNQSNFSRKMLVISPILADLFSLCDNLANPNISRFFITILISSDSRLWV